LSNGFVYILLNPAFPRQVKIGRTARNPQARAKELSRQTGVPEDFVVLYDALVADSVRVEQLLHQRFASYRSSRHKEFFHVPPKEAILALQELTTKFVVPADGEALSADLLPHFKKYFHPWLDQSLLSIHLVQLPGVCFLEVTRQPDAHQPPTTTREPIPLEGLVEPEQPTLDDLRANEALLRQCDEYDWIMISEVFPSKTAAAIAAEWERPGGKREQAWARARARKPG